MPIESQELGLRIRVLEGPLSTETLIAGQPDGTILLAGKAGPFKGAVWGGEMRMKTTWNPGNPNGTQQMIGDTIDPTTFTGEWNDIFLGDGQAMALVALFTRLRRSGASVEVSWGGGVAGDTDAPLLTSSAIVRTGALRKFNFTPDRVQDTKWEMLFEWRAEDTPAAPAVAATGSINPSEGFQGLTDDLKLATATWTAVSNGPQFAAGIPQIAADAMAQAFGAVDTVVDTIQNATGTVTAAVVIPTQAALQLIGACETGLSSIRSMEAVVLGLNLTLLEVADSALGLLELKDQVLSMLQGWGPPKDSCVDLSEGMQQFVEPDVIAEVRAPAGTSLRDLAITYFGDADMWFAIAKFNGLETDLVPNPPAGASDDPARPIRIPRPQPGASSDIRAQC